MKTELKLFHGSPSVVRIPDLSMSRADIDFGAGFYLSDDPVTASKWACRTAASVCNEYALSLQGLKVHRFQLDADWLEYVVRNRAENTETPCVFDEFDVLIGAIADDKLFHTIELYEDGLISVENAIKVMNCMDYGLQYVLKTPAAVDKLLHIGHIRIDGENKPNYRKQYQKDRREAAARANKLLRELNGR